MAAECPQKFLFEIGVIRNTVKKKIYSTLFTKISKNSKSGMGRRREKWPEKDGSEELETESAREKQWKEIIEQAKTHKEL
jgi:hypothetical protein